MCGRSRGRNRARDFVEALLDEGERLRHRVSVLLRELLDRAGQRAQTLVQRAHGQRFGKVVDGPADLLELLVQRLDVRRKRRSIGVDPALEGGPAPVEIVPAPVDGFQRVLASQRIERAFHLLQLEAQHVAALVVAALGERAHGVGQAVELHAELVGVGAGRLAVEALDVVPQRVKLALQALVHLQAQLLAHRLQFAGYPAHAGQAVFLAAGPLEIAREGPEVGARLECRLGATLRWVVLGRAPHFIVPGRLPTLELAFEIGERSVEILEGRIGPALPPGIECIEI